MPRRGVRRRHAEAEAAPDPVPRRAGHERDAAASVGGRRPPAGARASTGWEARPVRARSYRICSARLLWRVLDIDCRAARAAGWAHEAGHGLAAGAARRVRATCPESVSIPGLRPASRPVNALGPAGFTARHLERAGSAGAAPCRCGLVATSGLDEGVWNSCWRRAARELPSRAPQPAGRGDPSRLRPALAQRARRAGPRRVQPDRRRRRSRRPAWSSTPAIASGSGACRSTAIARTPAGTRSPSWANASATCSRGRTAVCTC